MAFAMCRLGRVVLTMGQEPARRVLYLDHGLPLLSEAFHLEGTSILSIMTRMKLACSPNLEQATEGQWHSPTSWGWIRAEEGVQKRATVSVCIVLVDLNEITTFYRVVSHGISRFDHGTHIYLI